LKLLLNTESLLPQLTEIGSYTHNLLRQFAKTPEFERVDCFNESNLLSADEQLQLVALSGADAPEIPHDTRPN
jgi:hypothetical protein